MFGKTLKHPEPQVNEVLLDDHANVYQPTIVDEAQIVVTPDGTSHRVSDVSILKGMSVDDSGALADALSMRMQVRPSSPDRRMSDTEIRAMIKSRSFQDITEVQHFSDYLKEQLEKGMSRADYERALELAKEADESTEPVKVE